MNWMHKNHKLIRMKRSRDDSDEESSVNLLNLMSKKNKCEDNLYVIDNNIYFQDDITHESISSLNREIRLLGNELIIMGNNFGIETPVIKLHITSYGGSVVAALSAIDCIEESKVPIHTIIDGYAASAATLISVHGSRRYIKKNASMLIHQLRSGVWGKMSEINDDYINLQKTDKLIKKIYLEKTKLKNKEINNILKHDLDWDAQECLKNGLVDEIL